mgnify:CR=1 FL=1
MYNGGGEGVCLPVYNICWFNCLHLILCFFTAGLTLFMQFPVLEIDGLKLTQSAAIARYVANKHGFMGKTPEENAQ